MVVMSIIEEHLGIYRRTAMYGGKMGHGFMPSIDIHIHRKEIVEYPITGYVVMEVLSLFIPMVYQHWGGYETLSIIAGEYG